jgi:hypothetical protein
LSEEKPKGGKEKNTQKAIKSNKIREGRIKIINLNLDSTLEEIALTSQEEIKISVVSNKERKIRDNVYSKIESTGSDQRDQIRRKLVKIFRDSLSFEVF